MQSAKTKPKPRLESDLAYVVSFCTFFYLILNEFLHFSAFFCIFLHFCISGGQAEGSTRRAWRSRGDLALRSSCDGGGILTVAT